MQNEFTAIIEREDEWFIAYCAEFPGANGQGRTSEEARANLGEAIALIIEDRGEDALRGVPEAVQAPAPAEWPADFRSAEDQSLEASLAATPSQRLAWLEEALAFALKVGALPRPDDETGVRNGVPLMPQRPKESERPTMDVVNRLRDES